MKAFICVSHGVKHKMDLPVAWHYLSLVCVCVCVCVCVGAKEIVHLNGSDNVNVFKAPNRSLIPGTAFTSSSVAPYLIIP